MMVSNMNEQSNRQEGKAAIGSSVKTVPFDVGSLSSWWDDFGNRSDFASLTAKRIKAGLILALMILVFFLGSGFRQLGAERIMMRMEAQSLHKGKRAEVQADIFYQSYDGRMITKYHKPVDHVMITNNKGELAIYNESDRTVYREQSLDYSSDNNLIYYFLTGRTQDLGLSQMGFSLMDTEFFDGLVKTSWFPPQGLYHLFSKIELVHEQSLPIFVGYYDASGKLVKKVYYSDYEQFPEIVLPLTVTEFNYLPGNDSIVNRIRFNDVRINHRANSPWFNFRIPDDAKILD